MDREHHKDSHIHKRISEAQILDISTIYLQLLDIGWDNHILRKRISKHKRQADVHTWFEVVVRLYETSSRPPPRRSTARVEQDGMFSKSEKRHRDRNIILEPLQYFGRHGMGIEI